MLRSVDFSETSRIVTFLTPGRGRVACMVHGARRPKSKFAALLDTLNRVELVYYWKSGRGVHTLAEAALLDGYGRIKRDLDKSLYAAFPAEIAYKAAHEDAPAEALYAILSNGLCGLQDWTGDAATHACWIAWRMLQAAGFEPELDRCVVTGDALPDAPGFALSGGATKRPERAEYRLRPEEFAALKALVWGQVCPAIPLPSKLFDIAAAYAAHHLESDFRSVRVIRAALPT